jgi:beta-lactamase regulating signal transducer with metallopeptidase domain
MNDLINAIVSNGTALLVGATLLLTFGCLAVAAHRSPVHRQRLAEFAIAATLIWLILAVTPLPRPLARGYFFELWQAIGRKALPEPAASPASLAQSPAQPLQTIAATATEPAPPASIELVRALSLVAPATLEDVVFDPHPGSDSLTQHDESVAEELTEELPETPAVAKEAPADAAAETSPAEVPPITLAARFAAFLRAKWKFLLLGVYGFGVALCVGWIVLGRVLLARIVRMSKPPEYWLNELFADLCEERGTTNVWLVLSERYPRAISFGIRRPTIVMPSALCVPENAELLRHVLRHELVHVGRRDAWGTLLFNLSFLFLFFHPAFWWLRSRARLSAELVADEWAATRSSRAEYAQELIAFVRATRRAAFLPAGATGVLGSTTPFTRRIEMLIRRERPLEMQSSPAWRIASCGVLGGLIIAMAASLGRTAQTEPETTKSEPASPPATIVVTVDDEDEKDPQAIAVITKDDDDEDDDAPKSGDKQLQKMQRQYEKLARKSAELQKQMAELQKALEESKAGHEHNSSTPSPHPHPHPHAVILKDHPHAMILKDEEVRELETMPGLEALKNLEQLKGLEGLKALELLKGLDFKGPHVLKDGRKFKIEIDDDDDASAGKKASNNPEHKAEVAKAKALGLAIKAKKAQKGDQAPDEETTIELKTDDGEMILEVGPDHTLKVKKLKGFGKSPADLEGLKKTLEKLGTSLHQAEESKELGELKPRDELKFLIDSETGRHERHGRKLKKKEKDSKESSDERFKKDPALAHRAQMEAVRAQIEAEQRLLEKLKHESEQLRKETSGSKDGTPSTGTPAPKVETQQRQVIVTTESTATASGEQKGRVIEKKVVHNSSRPAVVARRVAREEGKPSVVDRDVVIRTLVAGDQSKNLAKKHDDDSIAAAAIDSSTDLMRLAELASNAVGELEQAKAALEEAEISSGSHSRHLAEIRVRSAERKVQLLSRIAQSMHAVLAAKAKRLHHLREHKAVTESEVEEIDSKLRIVELILADVSSGPDKSATFVTPATPTAPASAIAPVAAVTPASPVAPTAPAARVAAVTRVAPLAPVAAVAPVATEPAAPATPAAPAKK